MQCEQLGLLKEKLSSYQSVDFCLDDICRMDWLVYFTAAKEVICCIQGITEIEGLDRCKQLEKLFLQQNKIEVIKGLSKLTSLRQLYLGSNQIK